MALLQSHLEVALKVPMERGYVSFIPVPADCAGWAGDTIGGETEASAMETTSLGSHKHTLRVSFRGAHRAFNEQKTDSTGQPGIISQKSQRLRKWCYPGEQNTSPRPTPSSSSREPDAGEDRVAA